MTNKIGNRYIWFFTQKKLCLVRKKISWFSEEKKNMKNYSSLDLFLRLGVLIYLIHTFFQIWNIKNILQLLMYILLSKTSSWKRKKKSKSYYYLLIFTEEWI